MSLQGFDEVVDCGAAMFLPRAEWRCWVSRRMPSDFVWALKRRDWSSIKYWLRGSTMRCANFKSYQWMGIYVERPMPWLRGPAEQLYPQLFER